MPRPIRGRHRWASWLLAALVATVAAAMTERSSQAPAPTETRNAHLSGVRAVIDPRTGQATANPSRTQLEALALRRRSATFSRSTVGLEPFGLTRGGRGVNLQGRFDTALRVERAADGTFRVTCGDPAHDSRPHSHPAASVPSSAQPPQSAAPPVR